MTLTESWREVSPYLDAVLDLGPEARQEWLNDLMARAPAMAERVRAYLRDLDKLEEQRFLDTPAMLVSEASLAGKRFGAYTLDREIGHGGTGTVWLAHRSDGQFEGHAAVKLLNTALIGHPSARRFAREASVLARLQHPNIAHLLDAGVEAGTQPYLILEYIRGEHIDRYCDEQRLSVEARIRLFLDVLSAVSHAHSNLIVHRDLKPSNILVNENGVVKLLDFGIAALLLPADAVGTLLTRNVAVGLTPGYASPEQLRGEPVTTATDVYALGLVLYLLLTGRHAFSAEGKTSAELMRLTLETDARRPSQVVSDLEAKRALRGDLDNIVAMALRRDPTQRYTTADHFAQDLRRYLALEPVSARPRSLRYLAGMFVRRNAAAVAAGISILIVLIAAIAITTTQMLDAREQRDRARQQSRRAEASRDFLDLLVLSDFGPSKLPPTLHERLERGVDMILKQYRGDPLFAGRMLVQMGENFRDNEETQRANELFAQGYEMGRGANDGELMAYAQCSRAFGEAYANIREGITERLAEAQRLLARLDHPDTDLLGLCALADSTFTLRSGDNLKAGEILERTLRMIEEEGETDRRIYASVLSALTGIYMSRNQPRDALRVSQQVGAIHDRDGRGGTADRLISRQNEASALQAMGESRAALEVREIVDRRISELDAADEAPPLTWVNYSLVLQRLNRPADALKQVDSVLERVRATGSPYVVASALLARGSTLVELKRWDEADAALKEAAALAASGITDRRAGSLIEAWMGRAALARGNVESAHQHVDASLGLAGYGTEKTERSLPTVLLTASRVAIARGEYAKAEQYARDALAVFEPMARGADTSADVGEALLISALARRGADPRADTKALVDRSVRCLTNGLGADHPLTIEARAIQ